jgi:phosphatidylethanolamine-binding protein (PEBP) family uncharacterized protein
MAAVVTAAVVLVLAASCSGRSTARGVPAAAPSTLAVTSPAFSAGGAVPAAYTCDGAGTSPPLSWSGVPAGTAEVVVSVTDPDAPGGTFVHWVVLGIPPDAPGLAAGGPLPAGARQASGSAGRGG